MRIKKGVRQITNLEEWFLLAPPAQGERHWKDGRSAKEMATEYLMPAATSRLRALLFPAFGTVEFVAAEPECSVAFDHFSGPRQCDLAIQAQGTQGNLIIHIEGKADESFGDYVGEVYDEAITKNFEPRRTRFSKVPQRIELLAQRMFGSEVHGIRALRYQLLFGVAATLADASRFGAQSAVFLIHEFHSLQTDERKLRRNHEDWKTFLASFKITVQDQNLEIMGPISVPYEEWNSVRLYFTKIVTLLPRTNP